MNEIPRSDALTAITPIDCDIHPAVPKLTALLPYLSDHWADTVVQRGLTELNTASYPDNAPLTARPEWRPAGARPASSLELVRRELLDRFDCRAALCNCLYGTHVLYSTDMASAFTAAVNDWLAAEWLAQDKRLFGAIQVPIQDPRRAAEEIDRCAANPRFVQVLLPVFADMPLGQRHYWPIYEAAERNGLPVCIHAGSTYRHPVTSSGWPSTFLEDYLAQAQGFQTQLGSLICEGVFKQFPGLRVVFAESGFTWLPAALWRLDKYWKGLRMEIPWVDRAPSEIARDHIRLTLQPVDAPPTAQDFETFVNHMESEDMLLFSTDYPHWQFDGEEVFPAGMGEGLRHRIQGQNPLATYPKLAEALQ